MDKTLNYCIAQLRQKLQNDRIGVGCDTAQKLCVELQDGELLCDLLSTIDANFQCQASSFYSCNSQLLARTNVQFFIRKCADHFKLSKSEIFEPEDLLLCKNPDRVLRTVRSLLLRVSQSEEEEAEENENVYETIEGAHPKLGELQFVLAELCKKEKDYVAKLTLLLRFRAVLLGCPLSEWPKQLVQSLFDGFLLLLPLHRQLEAHLERLHDMEAEKFCEEIGKLFADYKDRLYVYEKVFLANIWAKTNLSEKFEANSRLCDQVKQLEKQLQAPLFFSLYDCPFKQLFNYQNMLERLRHLASQALPSCAEPLGSACAKVKKLLKFLNESTRHYERETATDKVLQQLLTLPRFLTNKEVTGLHVADAEFKVKCSDKEKSRRSLCVLTEKMLIFGVHSGSVSSSWSYSFHLCISADIEIPRISNSTTQSLRILKPPDLKVTMTDLDSIQIDKWEVLLNERKSKNFPLGWNFGYHNFALATFPRNSQCTWCHKIMEGFIHQGYKCDHCTEQLHMRCVEKRTIQRRSCPSVMPNVSADNFFHPFLSREEAEARLQASTTGTFLFRPRSDDKTKKVLSITSGWGRCVHIKIMEEMKENKLLHYSLERSACWHETLNDLIAFYRNNSLQIHFPDLLFKLGDGVARTNGAKVLTKQRSMRQ